MARAFTEMTPLARWTVAAATAVFAASSAPAHASFLQELGSPFAVGAQPYGVVTADFNRDGRTDVMAVNGTGSTVTTILRRATGGFTVEGSTEAAKGANYGAVADFNRDGWMDVAVSGYEVPGEVAVLLRDPAGGFVKAKDSPYPVAKAGAVAVADFNGDDRMDVVASRYDGLTGNTVVVLLQKVDGSFSAEANPAATGVAPRYISVADFNVDGRPDLAVSNRVSGSVTILLRKATGAGFDQEAGSPHKVGGDPIALAVTDISGDGRPDVASANYSSDTVSVLARRPEGGFAPAVAVPAGDGPVGVIAADFNRDGQVDLVTANNIGDNISVLLRQPDGSYVPEAGSPYPAADGPNQIASADFNGDAKADLAISNDQSNNLTVLLNTTPDPVQPQPPPPAAAPGPGPTAPVNTVVPSINARLVLTWTITKTRVKLTSATLRDLPAGGATVKIACKTCKVRQTVTAKKATLTLSKLRNKQLKRGASFTITVSKPGYNGLTFTRKVKNYGRTKAALRKAVKAPFSETRRVTRPSGG